MINRQALLSDLQSLLKKLEADLLDRSKSSDVPEVGQTLREEYARANKAERTALNFETWRSDAITQTAAAWVLSCVFVRFLEDNALIDPPKIAGPGERLRQARDEHTLFFQDPERAKLTDREYLLAMFDQLAELPGTRDVFGEHNPLRQLPNWLGPDAAGELLKFFQKIDANSGELIHDFTDPDWNTRFLGDLYQDLSEAARKKYALLQTPDFVEEFILDRTLEPALDEFGLDAKPEGFKMIDPACGSGHFLLGAFTRILARWQKQEPGTKVRELVGRALHSVHGVDVNPFAIAIARFRLLLAAMQAEGITRLANAPGYEFRLATGDSLYHSRQRQKTLLDDGEEIREDAHYFASEDAADLRKILRPGSYHCVVANPPYITPKDRAANQAYRQLYPDTCHMKYSLAVPFMELLFRLAAEASGGAGYVGQITANSFMKREFGKKLIESFFPKVDLTHVIDTSGAYIPGHGTPTVILLGRNRRPVSPTIRTVMGIRGEPSTPANPAQGQVWSAIVGQIDRPGSESEFVSVGDSERDRFHVHPWSIGGGGAAELKELLEEGATTALSSLVTSIGITSFTLEDDIYILPKDAAQRSKLRTIDYREMVVGDSLRDWTQGERLSTADTPQGAWRNIVDGWFYALEEDVLAEGSIDPNDQDALVDRTNQLLEQRLAKLSGTAPTFSAALRGYRQAQASGDQAISEGILAWLAGQPNVSAAAKRACGVKGDIDHFGALSFLQGVLLVLRDSGSPGLLLILDEVETIQRVRSDVRDKSLNALRQLIDEVDSGRFPGLYLLITGTPAFYEGPQGIQRLEPLAQRLHVDFQTDARFDNPRAPQIRLPGFSLERLRLVGCKVRDIYGLHAEAPERISTQCDDAYVQGLAEAVTGKLGGKVGVAPRIFLKKLVTDVLDRVDQHPDFDPREHYTLTMNDSEMTPVERQAMGATDVDEIELDL